MPKVAKIPTHVDVTVDWYHPSKSSGVVMGLCKMTGSNCHLVRKEFPDSGGMRWDKIAIRTDLSTFVNTMLPILETSVTGSVRKSYGMRRKKSGKKGKR